MLFTKTRQNYYVLFLFGIIFFGVSKAGEKIYEDSNGKCKNPTIFIHPHKVD